MAKVLFLVSILAAFVFAQEEQTCTVYNPCGTTSAEVSTGISEERVSDYSAKPGISGFFFDLTIAGTRRHLEATKTTSYRRDVAPGCRFESDGRYVCDNSDKKTSYGEKTIGYTGMGALLAAKFGGAFKSMFAIFANFEMEITSGDVSGREESESIKPRSAFFGGGPGVTLYPFFYMNSAMQNLYASATANILIGGGGGIGSLGGDLVLELGYLWPVSDRVNVGLALGGDVLSSSRFETNIKDEGGYSLWIGFKVVRK